MDNSLNPYEERHKIRKALLEIEHKKRIFDISGISKKELDSYRSTIFVLLAELDEAADRLQELQGFYGQEQVRRKSSEREVVRLEKENVFLADCIADFQKNIPPTIPLSVDGSLDELPLAERVKNLLLGAKFNTIRDLFAFTIHDFTKIPGFGKNALMDVNQALFRKGLPQLSGKPVSKPYTGGEPIILHDVNAPVEALKLHPHLEHILKKRGKYTVRAVLTTTQHEKNKMFDWRGHATTYLWKTLTMVIFPARAVPTAVVIEYGNNELFFRSPAYFRLSTHTMNVLTENDILTIGDLLIHSRHSLRKTTGFCFDTIDPIQRGLKKHNLGLRRMSKEFGSG